MGVISRDDIRGAREADGRILCNKDMGPVREYGQHDFILESDLEGDDLYFCDECESTL